jgi:hypothetical protein
MEENGSLCIHIGNTHLKPFEWGGRVRLHFRHSFLSAKKLEIGGFEPGLTKMSATFAGSMSNL